MSKSSGGAGTGGRSVGSSDSKSGIVRDGDISMGINAYVGNGGLLRLETANTDDEDRQWFTSNKYDIPQSVRDSIANRMRNEVLPIYRELRNSTQGSREHLILLNRVESASSSARNWANRTYNWNDYKKP